VDAVVVGGGLAGLSAALTLLDRGGRVLLLDKEVRRPVCGGAYLWWEHQHSCVKATTITACTMI
jgi:flavin-dependent dehydrogenase